MGLTMAIPLEIGHLSFSSKTAAKEHFRAIRIRWEDKCGKPLDGQDLKDVMAVVELHPKFASLPSNNIRSIVVDRSGHGNNACFQVMTTNHETIDFSPDKVIDGDNPFADLLGVCRIAVVVDIHEFKNEEVVHLNVGETYICPITNKETSSLDMTVGHVGIKFREIVRMWLQRQQCDDVTQLIQRSNGQKYLKQEFAESFRAFHKEHAKFQLQSSEGQGVDERGDRHWSKD